MLYYSLMKKVRVNGLLLLIIFLGTFLRVFKLGSKSFWFDEAATALVSRQTFATILNTTINQDSNPGLYYYILHFWLYLGNNEFTLRLLSAIFGIFTIYLIYLIAKDLFNKKIGILSAFIVAISPFHVYFAQELRMYTLVTFLVLLSAYFFIKALKDNKPLYWVWYVIITILAIYTHFYVIYFVVVTNLFFFLSIKRYRKIVKKWTLIQVILLISYIPVIILLFKTMFHYGTKETGIFNSLILTETYFDFGKMIYTFIRIPSIFRSFAFGVNTPYFFNFRILTYTAMIIIALIFLKQFTSKKSFLKNFKAKLKDERIAFLLIILFFPILITVFLTSILKVPFNDKYFLMFSFPYYILIANGIFTFRNHKLKLLLLSFIVLSSFIHLNVYYNFEKPDWRGATKYIESNSNPNDIILISVSWEAISFKHYYNGNLTVRGLPSDKFDLLDPNIRRDNKINETNVRTIENLVKDYDNAWLIFSRKPRYDPYNLTLKWMDEYYQRSELYFAHKPDEFSGIIVYNYKLK